MNDTGSGYLNRRGFLQVMTGAATTWPFRRWYEEWRALGLRPAPKSVTPYITPNDDFYLVAVDPSFRPALDDRTVVTDWSLELSGSGGESRALLRGVAPRSAPAA